MSILITIKGAAQCGTGTLAITNITANCNGTYSVNIGPVAGLVAPCVWSGWPNISSVPCEFTGINIPPGTFNVTVTDNVGTVQHYCAVLNNFTFPGFPNFTITNETCALNDGTIVFNPAGFTVTNTIWTDALGNLVNIGASTVTNLAPGNYTCTVFLTVNGTACQTTITPLTVQPWTPISITITPPSSADCGGNAFATISGGNGSFSYQWSGPTWMTEAPNSGTTSGGTLSTNISGGYGNITISVIDQLTGCTATALVNYSGFGCAADLDGNGMVMVNDLIVFMASFGTSSGGCADFDGNGVVNTNDLMVLMTAFGITGC